jgi:hypothetical protein
MTQTTQPRSWAFLSETEKDLTLNKPKAEDNMSLLISVFDSLNNLYEKLCRLEYVMQRRNMEFILLQEDGNGETK